MNAILQEARAIAVIPVGAVLTTLGAHAFATFLLITPPSAPRCASRATASAYFVHVVAPGESLSSIAAQPTA